MFLRVAFSQRPDVPCDISVAVRAAASADGESVVGTIPASGTGERPQSDPEGLALLVTRLHQCSHPPPLTAATSRAVLSSKS